MPKSKKKRSRPSFSSPPKRKKSTLEEPAVEAVIGDYWEIEAVKDFRTRSVAAASKGRRTDNEETVMEFLVQWKGPYGDTWEPEESLCDSAMIEATMLVERAAVQQLGLETTDRPVKNPPKSKPQSTKKQKGTTNKKEVAEEFWEIQKVKDFRTSSGGDVEFLVQWKGPYKDTWEPKENLSDEAVQEAMQLMEEEDDFDYDNDDLVREKESKDNGGGGTAGTSTQPKDCLDDTHFDWNSGDASYLHHQPIERISVTDPNCPSRVTLARSVGIPIVVTGHVGWAQFAKRWLVSSSPPAAAAIGSASMNETDATVNGMEKNDSTDIAAPLESDQSDKVADLQTQPTLEAAADGDEDKDVVTDDHVDKDDDETLLDLSQPHIVDVQKMSNDIGDELVPILRKRYDESEPIKQHLSIRRFLRDCWPVVTTGGTEQDSDGKSSTVATATGNDEQEADDSDDRKVAAVVPVPVPKKNPRASLYMHQWLFTASETAVPKLCGPGKNIPLPDNILGDDLLRYWYNKDRCNGDSPYQYLFMGNTGTMSKLHCDSGGLLISIAPLVGKKEVVLVHRDDGPTALYDLEVNLEKPDLHRFPMLYSARIWKSIIEPGEILLMPQGTYHQCRNVTPCLSYHRFHLDAVNLGAFFASMKEKDGSRDHGEILWNLATELYSTVDIFVYKLRGEQSSSPLPPDIPSEIQAAVATLRIVHKVCRAVVMDHDNETTSDCYTYILEEWSQLVTDIESTLHDFRYRRRPQIPPFRKARREATSKRNGAGNGNKENRELESNRLENIDADDEAGGNAEEVADVVGETTDDGKDLAFESTDNAAESTNATDRDGQQTAVDELEPDGEIGDATRSIMQESDAEDKSAAVARLPPA